MGFANSMHQNAVGIRSHQAALRTKAVEVNRAALAAVDVERREWHESQIHQTASGL